jgi:hypothetical protein
MEDDFPLSQFICMYSQKSLCIDDLSNKFDIKSEDHPRSQYFSSPGKVMDAIKLKNLRFQIIQRFPCNNQRSSILVIALLFAINEFFSHFAFSFPKVKLNK